MALMTRPEVKGTVTGGKCFEAEYERFFLKVYVLYLYRSLL